MKAKTQTLRAGKPKPAAKIPATITLAGLVGLTGEHERQIRRICPKPLRKGVYHAGESVRALVDYYRAQAGKVSDSAAADKARQAKADADRSELALAKELEVTCLASDVRLIWDSVKVKFRKALQRSGLSESERVEVIELLQGIKLDGIEGDD